jgi:hypothetical protein
LEELRTTSIAFFRQKSREVKDCNIKIYSNMVGKTKKLEESSAKKNLFNFFDDEEEEEEEEREAKPIHPVGFVCPLSKKVLAILLF